MELCELKQKYFVHMHHSYFANVLWVSHELIDNISLPIFEQIFVRRDAISKTSIKKIEQTRCIVQIISFSNVGAFFLPDITPFINRFKKLFF